MKNVFAVSGILKGRTSFSALDCHDALAMARSGDLVYMEPPYQGVTNARDNRYFSGVPFHEFAEALQALNDRRADYLISYDGTSGSKEYGEDLPESLGCKKIMLNAGVSSQAALLGKNPSSLKLFTSVTLLRRGSPFNSLAAGSSSLFP